MIEFWAVVGLTIVDEEFLEALVKVKRDISKLRRVVKEYGFRLSRYEFGELQRLLNAKLIGEELEELRRVVCNLKDPKDGVDIPSLLAILNFSYWFHGDSCWTAITFDRKYRHCYVIYKDEGEHDEDQKSAVAIGKASDEEDEFVPGFVDPVTGKPLKAPRRPVKRATKKRR